MPTQENAIAIVAYDPGWPAAFAAEAARLRANDARWRFATTCTIIPPWPESTRTSNARSPRRSWALIRNRANGTR